jgi:hypothetical protein
MSNKNLILAKKAKNDEFYTQYINIEKELEVYFEYNPDYFKNKVVYCNCDDPKKSNFVKYFLVNFNRFRLKKLIATHYIRFSENHFFNLTVDRNLEVGSKLAKVKPNYLIVNQVNIADLNQNIDQKDMIKQIIANPKNEWGEIKGDGDFRSPECVELLKKSDIVVTNPPFSLFREYVKLLFDYNKKFLIIGNMNAICYQFVFKQLKEKKMWLSRNIFGGVIEFQVPDFYVLRTEPYRIDERGKKYVKINAIRWYTNLKHGYCPPPLKLMTMEENLKFNKKIQKNPNAYQKYDNFDAIEVPYTNAIPSDYQGAMGVPISFLDKYNPDQFVILGMSRHDVDNSDGGLWQGGKKGAVINGKELYIRIFIKHKKEIKNKPK